MRHTFARIHKRTPKLSERATLRIHKKRIKEEKKENEFDVSRFFLVLFCTRAHAHTTEHVLALKRGLRSILVFQKSRHLNSNLGETSTTTARDKNGARSGHATRREGKSLFAFFVFLRAFDRERVSSFTRRGGRENFRLQFAIPNVLSTTFCCCFPS
jgi:hypothetical protein